MAVGRCRLASCRESDKRKRRGVSCRKAALAEASRLRLQRKSLGLERIAFLGHADKRRDRRAALPRSPRARSKSSYHPAQRQIRANTRGGGDRGVVSEFRFRATQKFRFSLPLLSPRTGAIDRQVKLAKALMPCTCRSLFRRDRSEGDPRRLRLHAC